MSLPTKPVRLPDVYDPRAIERALQDILTAMNQGYTFIRLQALAAEPERTVANMTVNANGTTWDPGSGAGYYRRDRTNTAWVFLG